MPDRGPAVTAVIPCFNQGQFLAECIGSLRAQSFGAWHAIVVDDASTDGVTPDLCDSFADSQVTVLHLPTNQGRSLARNAGIERATTEAILSLDADDALELDHLRKTVPLLEDPRVGMVYTDYRLFGARTGLMRGRPFDLATLYRWQYIFAGSLFRRSAWQATGGYSDDFRIGNEDWDFWLRIAEAGFVGAYVPQPLFRYRLHAQSWSSTGAHGADRDFRSRLLLLEHHREGFERHGMTQEFLAESHAREARRLDACGQRLAAARHWRQVRRLRPLDLKARWQAWRHAGLEGSP